MKQEKRGFTLIELVVVVTMIGILTAIAVPQYIKSVETSRADEAVALLKMVGNSNRMFALDNNGTYLLGQVTTACNNSGTCTGTSQNVCNLIGCKYMVSQDWSSNPYSVWACDGGNSVACATPAVGAAKNLAVVRRVTGATPGATVDPYSGWGYVMDINGVVTTLGSAPTPTGL